MLKLPNVHRTPKLKLSACEDISHPSGVKKYGVNFFVGRSWIGKAVLKSLK
jgi:hypothetical protein